MDEYKKENSSDEVEELMENLMEASFLGDVKKISTLIQDQGFNLRQKNSKNKTAFHIAVLSKKLSVNEKIKVIRVFPTLGGT